MELIAKTFKGLENVLAAELIEMGADEIQIGNRMVSFDGDKAMMYRANFALHTALRVLMPIKHFKASDADALYQGVKDIEWEQYMSVENTFAIDAVAFGNEYRNSQFVAYRVKDAIVDRWRDITEGKRPNVSVSHPDIRINVHIAEEDVTVSLDSSGDSLHLRGYRVDTVAAPLNEVLAAGIIKMTGWKGETDFIDPMCGSGTLLIEAGLIARNMAPGIFRQDYGFMHWPDFDEDLWQMIYDDDSEEREFKHRIYGYDLARQAVEIATKNVTSAGLADCVEVTQRDIADFEQPLEPALMVTNPPYGERITTDDLLGTYKTIGTILKQNFAGNDAFVLSSNMDCFDAIGLKPSVKIELLNGAIECELRKYRMFSGRYDEMRAGGGILKTEIEKAQMKRQKGPARRREGDREFKGRREYRNERSERTDRRERQERRSDKRTTHTSDRKSSSSWEAQRKRLIREMKEQLGRNEE